MALESSSKGDDGRLGVRFGFQDVLAARCALKACRSERVGQWCKDASCMGSADAMAVVAGVSVGPVFDIKDAESQVGGLQPT